MNKFLLGSFVVLIFSGCFFLKTKSIKPKKELDSTILYASLYTNIKELRDTKIKTKITISKDSIIASAYSLFGMEMGRITITNSNLDIENKFENYTQSILMLDIDPKFKIRDLKRSIIQLTNKQDTLKYENKYINCRFTDYIYKNEIFVPSKIIYWKNGPMNKQIKKNTINLDYKSIIFIE